MPIEVGIWRIDNGEVRRVNAASLEAERRLEDVLVKEISILGVGPLLILDRQVRTEFGGFIDILAVDGEGVIHVIELKKDQTPREIVAQALDYGSWVSNLGTERIAEIFGNGRFANGRSLQEAFTDQFGSDLPETINESHQLILVATQLDASTERIVQYLLDDYGVPINAVFFAYFNDAGAEYIARSWLRDPTDAGARSNTNTKRTRERWNEHDFYISFGDGPRRNREDARKYGFISGGGDRWYSQSLQALRPGHRVFVYLPQRGYVGVGTVRGPATPANDFKIKLEDGREIPVLEVGLNAPEVAVGKDDPALAEYFVPVEWVTTRPASEAYREPGFFANQNTAARFRHRATLEKLYAHFGVSAAESSEAPVAASQT